MSFARRWYIGQLEALIEELLTYARLDRPQNELMLTEPDLPAWLLAHLQDVQSVNLFGAVTNGAAVIVASSSATRRAYSGWVLSPVPTAVPPSASSAMCGA